MKIKKNLAILLASEPEDVASDFRIHLKRLCEVNVRENGTKVGFNQNDSLNIS